MWREIERIPHIGALTSTTTTQYYLYPLIMNMMTMLTTRFYIPFLTLFFVISGVFGLPTDLSKRTEPYFPDDPLSCPKCAAEYDKIQHCAAAAPVLANFTMVIFNPGAFIDVIQCACTETFQAVFPQCVDCFIRTSQTEVLECSTEELPEVLKGLRNVCAVSSAILGNVTSANNETTPTPPPVTDPNGALRGIVETHAITFALVFVLISVLS